MTDTTPWRPASGPPAGAGHTRVPAAPAPTAPFGEPAGREDSSGPAGYVPDAPAPAAGGPGEPGPGFVTGGLPGGGAAARGPHFGAAGYPGGAPAGLGVRVAARTTTASANAPGARGPADGLGEVRSQDASARSGGGQ
ncbi:hypothetical protein ACFW2C_33040, partial [Streptomyces sp. NPDC058875]